MVLTMVAILMSRTSSSKKKVNRNKGTVSKSGLRVTGPLEDPYTVLLKG